LIGYDSNPNTKDKDDNTPLSLALLQKNWEVALKIMV
jgi:hypothetical protein